MSFLPILQIVGKVLFIFIFFGLCIFLHELGHLLVALWRKLHVERFSVGFGKKLWGRTYNGVEYIVSLLPFGGYVALPQLDPTDEPQTEKGDPLPRAKPIDRILTAAAGPIANLIFGFFLALFIWWFGVYKPAPAKSCEVIAVPPVLLAQDSSVGPDDQFATINGKSVTGNWQTAFAEIGLQAGDDVMAKLQGKDQAEETPIKTVTNPEYAAGLRAGDRIVKVNGQPFTGGWTEVRERIVLTSGDVTLQLLRNNQDVEVSYRPYPNPLVEGLGYPFFDVGTPTVVHRTLPGQPAALAGLKKGDIILKVNGKVVADTMAFIDAVNASAGKELILDIDRGGNRQVIKGLYAAAQKEQDQTTSYRIGAVLDAPMVLAHPNPWQQFVEVVMRTAHTIRPLVSQNSLVKPRHMSGPIGIINILLYKVLYGGWRDGLSFIILITFSLAFFNLLPIPVLDGGHILFALIETIIRRPIPVGLARAIQTAFAVLLITFMIYVTFFDIRRVGRTLKLRKQQTTEDAQPAPSAQPAPAETSE
jgi:regulator of sigma E protease